MSARRTAAIRSKGTKSFGRRPVLTTNCWGFGFCRAFTRVINRMYFRHGSCVCSKLLRLAPPANARPRKRQNQEDKETIPVSWAVAVATAAGYPRIELEVAFVRPRQDHLDGALFANCVVRCAGFCCEFYIDVNPCSSIWSRIRQIRHKSKKRSSSRFWVT